MSYESRALCRVPPGHVGISLERGRAERPLRALGAPDNDFYAASQLLAKFLG
jgi:hypothetical protein